MVSFVVYDLIFLVLFTVAVVIFLRTRRKDLGREGIIFMFRTQAGVDAIEWVGSKFKGLLHSLKYLIITVGFVLMAAMVWMLAQTVSIYVLHPEITKLVKAPPIAPLIPYFPRLFGMQSFFPPFYFTYFLVALAIVAVAHEFSHGIYMKLFGVKIKSTGLVFLGPILGAFVEQDDKSFKKKTKIEQMTVLGAGVFANVIIALIFYGLYVAFFFSSFTASGYVFNGYTAYEVPVGSIESVGADVGPMMVFVGGGIAQANLTEVNVENRTYYVSAQVRDRILQGVDLADKTAVIIEKSPAMVAQMRGAIIMANDVEIRGQEDLREFLESKNPGETVIFTTEDYDGVKEYELVLGEHPSDPSMAYVGVSSPQRNPKGIVQNFLAAFMNFKDPATYYKPSWNGNFVEFVYHLFWWVMIINLLVALFNMMPLGMLDGGRFFYLTTLGITRSKKVAKWAFKIATYAILFVFLLLMYIWFVRII